jgi:integrase
VFPGGKPNQPIVNTAKPWKRLLLVAKIEPARVHDLRHTAASIGVASGASLALIGGVLGHKSQQTTQRYAHLSDDPVRAVSDDIANRIDRTMEGRGAEIIKLKPAGKS